MENESIPDFFRNRSIFVTGGTGFMGKVLIEKLAYSCPDIKKIYILLRSRNGVGGFQRVQELIKLPVFNRMKEERPGAIEQILHPIEGDIKELGLGISDEDRNLLVNEVSVIFHIAASVSFNDPIKDAIIINTRGTREVIQLAKELKNIVALLHVSTTFCNCYRETVEEIIYPAPVSWKEAIYVAETTDNLTMSLLDEKYRGYFPNSYVFSKNLSEKLVEDECRNIPTVIYRPSIVICADQEPLPGWIDNFNGAIGLLFGIGKGIIRVSFSSIDTRSDYMPVDISIKGMIVAVWKKAIKNKNNPGITVYNSATGSKSMNMKELMDSGMYLIDKYPFVDTLWMPQIELTDNITCFNLLFIIKQLMPAIAVDTLYNVMSRKSLNMVRLQRKIYQASIAFSYFTSQNWNFVNNKFVELSTQILEEDLNAFNFDFRSADSSQYLERAFLGGQKYLFNTNLEDLPKAISRMERLRLIKRAIKFWLFSAMVYFAWSYLNTSPTSSPLIYTYNPKGIISY